jgi:hypothetical protein
MPFVYSSYSQTLLLLFFFTRVTKFYNTQVDTTQGGKNDFFDDFQDWELQDKNSLFILLRHPFQPRPKSSYPASFDPSANSGWC